MDNLSKPSNTVVLEQASLELVPKSHAKDKSCNLVKGRFGISPEMQILDDNYHHQIVERLPDNLKRGRPDVVHFALLDITSTPAFIEGLVEVYLHTVSNTTIKILPKTRPPRTLQRFCGVMGKILSYGNGNEELLFEVWKDESIEHLIDRLNSDKIICLSSEGPRKDLLLLLQKLHTESNRVTWIIGGFPHGHFTDQVKALASDVISISEHSLAAHVVAARLCFGIEQFFVT